VNRGFISSLLLTALASSPVAGGELPAGQDLEATEAAAGDVNAAAAEYGRQPDETPPEDSGDSILSGKSVLSDLLETGLDQASLFPQAGAALHQRISDFREQLDVFDLKVSTDYSALFQHASSTLSGDNTASSQVFRLLGTWLNIGDPDGHHGRLVWKGEYRGAFLGNPAPRDMGFDTGSALSTANYKEMGWGLTDFYWHQRFNGDKVAIKVGHMDPGDWADQYPLLNAWTRFLNDAFYNNPTESIPKRGFGIVGHTYLRDRVYLMGGIHDANGPDTRPDFDQLFDSREFMTWAEIGYRGERNLAAGHNVHVHIWQQDAREEEGTERSKGITFSWSNVIRSGVVPFLRMGYSEGDAPAMRRFIGAGANWRLFDRDVLGFATSWGSPPDRELRDQVTTEAFYRLQVTRNIVLTPNLQVYYQPAYNPDKDWVSVVGLRFRVVF
jgi:porin